MLATIRRHLRVSDASYLVYSTGKLNAWVAYTWPQHRIVFADVTAAFEKEPLLPLEKPYGDAIRESTFDTEIAVRPGLYTGAQYDLATLYFVERTGPDHERLVATQIDLRTPPSPNQLVDLRGGARKTVKVHR